MPGGRFAPMTETAYVFFRYIWQVGEKLLAWKCLLASQELKLFVDSVKGSKREPRWS